MKKGLRRLELILEYGQTALDFMLGKSLAQWREDIKLRYAVAHALAGAVENIKEYSKTPEAERKLEELNHIEWKLIIRFRDKLIHHYEVLDQDVLYEFVTIQLPDVLEAVRTLKNKERDQG